MFESIDQLAPSAAIDPAAAPRDLGGLLGLLGQREVAFPLSELRVRASLAGNCCRTIVEQVFQNPYAEGLEAVHIFPLPPDGAVTELELRAGDVIVRGECRERQAAEQAFDQARRDGRRAALLTAERADVHTVRVTNIPPGTSVRVRLVIVERLEEADGAFLWRFPTVIAPRYLPGASETGHAGPGVLPDTDRVPDASRLQPPLRLSGGVRFDLEAEIAGPLASLESSLHAVRATLGETVRVAPSGRATLNRDFVVRFVPAVPEDASAPVPGAASGDRGRAPVVGYTDGAFTLAIVHPPADLGHAEAVRVPRDLVLVVDISGSMSGEKLDAAKQAVRAVLHGLDRGDRFRLIAFESDVHPHTPRLVEFDQRSLEEADLWASSLRSMGGTEMAPALAEAFSGDTPSGRLRTVVFITDGQAWNEPELAALVARARRGALLFTVGIDTAVNQSLLSRLARVGGGTCELVAPQGDIEEAIVRLEARIGSPVATALVPRTLERARPEPLAVFSGRSVPVLLRGAADSVIFDARDPSGRPIELAMGECRRMAFPLGALWARERVAWVEDRLVMEPGREAELRAEILAVALEHKIASRFTAFVAVEERVSHTGERVTVVQPVELPQAWSQEFLALPNMAGPSMAMASRVMRSASRSQVAGLWGRMRSAIMPAGGDSAGPFDAEGEAPEFDVASLGASDTAEHFERAPEDYSPELPAVLEPLVETNRASSDPRHEIETMLATTQDADGSFGGRVDRTAAALVALVCLGHTRRKGSRRRVVEKAARWLAQHESEGHAHLALALLDRAEAGGERPEAAEVMLLVSSGPEGQALDRALRL
jgi:Ca-activated chloride channel family protein